MRRSKLWRSICLISIMGSMLSGLFPCYADWEYLGLPVHCYFVLQPAQFDADLIVGSEGHVYLKIADQWGDLPLPGADFIQGIETESGDVLLLVRETTETGAVYGLNPDPLDLDLILPVESPVNLFFSSDTRRCYLATETELQVSLDSRNWFHVEHFQDNPVTAICDSSQNSLALLALNATGIHLAEMSPDYGSGEDQGRLAHEPISEASGLAASSINPGVFWTHNDSGGDAALFALDTSGTHLGKYTLDGVPNRDWEDMAVATVQDTTWLYVGDIGDNDRVHSIKYVYRVPEPDVSPDQTPGEWNLSGTETLAFQYPDDEKFDCETLMVDPDTGDLYVVTKRNHNNSATDDDEDLLFRIPWHPSTPARSDRSDYLTGKSISRNPVIAEFITVIDIPVAISWGAGYGATGGDIDPSSTEIIIRTYTGIYQFQRMPGQSLADAFSNEWIEVPVSVEAQGEAVCWGPDAMHYYTTSEEPYSFLQAHLYQFSRSTWLQQHAEHPFSHLSTAPGYGVLSICRQGHNGDGIYLSQDQGQTWSPLLRSSGISALSFAGDTQVLLGWDSILPGGGHSAGAAWLNIETGDLVHDDTGLWGMDITGISTGDQTNWLATPKGVYAGEGYEVAGHKVIRLRGYGRR